MVLTLGNGQIWLGTPPVVLQFILAFFYFVVCNCLFAKNIHSHYDIGKMTECFWQYASLKNFNFFSGNLNSRTYDLCSLSLLLNPADPLLTSVPWKVRNCAEPPEHLRSEISFSCPCNIPNLTSYIHRIALSKRFTGCVYMVVKLHAHWSKHLLNIKFSYREHGWWLTPRTCVNTLINETNVKYEATTLYQFEVLLFT